MIRVLRNSSTDYALWVNLVITDAFKMYCV